MTRWKLYGNWKADLAGLTVEQLRERRAIAARRAQDAVARRAGRNPKAATPRPPAIGARSCAQSRTNS
ncbi:hypothetical protein [Streptomyces sp. NPDC048248]|uniref:hypothetical protein n=1 Tax=Streptomyces sp. NPDC048248 TaxID=3365523 RepID=UPI003723E481